MKPITTLTPEQKALYHDIMAVLKKEQHQKLTGDSVQIVFGRIYSNYCLMHLANNKKIQIKQK